MRYAIALTSALLLGGATATLALQPAATAQTAQNEPGTIAAAAPRGGAPMSFADMVARLQPAVVNISTQQRVRVQSNNPFSGTPFEQFFGQQQGGGAPVTREAQSLGSGFLISDDGYVVTNSHVISAGQRGATVDSITVTLPDRREFTAKLIGRDPASDLAVLKIDARGLPFVKFGDSARARVGDWIVAIGNPFGLGSTVTAGIVSALHRVTGQGGAYDRFIQTDASINQGNSGGPMFNLSGDVIGINSQILSPTGGNVGIGFAIPAEEAQPIIQTLMKGGSVTRGYLGVGIQQITDDIATALNLPKNRGEIISRVEPGEGAAKAGIRQGDVVTAVNGRPVTPDDTLSYLVANLRPGQTAKIDLIRDGRPLSVNATVGTRPAEEQLAGFNAEDQGLPDAAPDGQPGAAASALGFSVLAMTPQIARDLGVDATVQGVVVDRVDPATDAGTKLRRGDIITQIDGSPATVASVANAVTVARRANRTVVLVFRQRGRTPGGFIPIKLR